MVIGSFRSGDFMVKRGVDFESKLVILAVFRCKM